MLFNSRIARNIVMFKTTWTEVGQIQVFIDTDSAPYEFSDVFNYAASESFIGQKGSAQR